MYEEALRVVLEMGKASSSTLQRRLRLGYGRAARILDMMHKDDIIGPPDGSKPREVLNRSDWLREVVTVKQIAGPRIREHLEVVFRWRCSPISLRGLIPSVREKGSTKGSWLLIKATALPIHSQNGWRSLKMDR